MSDKLNCYVHGWHERNPPDGQYRFTKEWIIHAVILLRYKLNLDF